MCAGIRLANVEVGSVTIEFGVSIRIHICYLNGISFRSSSRGISMLLAPS